MAALPSFTPAHAAASEPAHSARIRSVETFQVRVPFANSFTIAAPHSPSRDGVDVLVVRIHSDAGPSGIGETQAWRRQGSPEVLQNLAYLVNNLFAPAMVGQPVLDISGILARLNAIAYDSLYAQAAVGDALYDLAGKLLGVPVHALLGGKCRDRIPVGIALSITSSPDAMIEQAQKAYDRGYRHIRVKIGIDPRRDVVNVRALREHFGDKVVLRADANGGMTFEQALPLLRRLEAYDLEYVEQPISGWDLEGMAALARSTSIPISADESLTTDHSLMKIAQARAATIIQTKVGKNGGIHYSKALWTIAKAAGIGIFPGNHPGTSLQTASVTHLCAAWPHPLLVGDYQMFATDEITADVVTPRAALDNGCIVVSDAPGLGVELDEESVERLRVDR